MSLVSRKQITEYRRSWDPEQYAGRTDAVAVMMTELCKHKCSLTDDEISEEILEIAERVETDPS